MISVVPLFSDVNIFSLYAYTLYMWLNKLTFLALQTKTNTFPNIVYPDETVRNEYFHLNLLYLTFCIDL